MSVLVRVPRGIAYAWLIVGIPFAVFEGLFVFPKQTMTMLTAMLGWVVVGWNLATRIGFDPTLAVEAGAALVIIVVLLHLLFVTLHRGQHARRPAQWRWRSTLTALPIVMLLLVAGLAATGLTHEAIRLTTMRPTWFIGTHSPEFAMQEARESSQTLRDAVAEFYRDRGRFPDQGDAPVGVRVVHPRARYFRSFTLQPNGRIVFELNDQELDGELFELQAVGVGEREVRWGCLRDLRPHSEDGCRHPDRVRAEGRS